MKQEALKLALDALETELSIDWTNNDEFNASAEKMHEAITAIKETLAQEQEPVAWVSEDVCKGQYIDGRPRKIWWECEKGVGTAFYTTPPQRTWVGLTKGEVYDLYDSDYVVFHQRIEAKLKEKNT